MLGLYWDHVGIDGLSWPALWLEKQIVVPLFAVLRPCWAYCWYIAMGSLLSFTIPFCFYFADSSASTRLSTI